MFHPQVIENSIKKLWENWGGDSLPRELSIQEADDLTRRLAKHVDAKGNQIKELSTEEQALIRNEVLMCKASFPYMAERYLIINAAGQGLKRMFPLLESQKFILQKLGEKELLVHEGAVSDGILVNLLKGGRQIGGCLRPNTRVLTADLRWITLDEVQVGQELVAIDEEFPGGRGKARKLRRAIVEGKRELIAFVYELELENGSKLYATPDHRFLSHGRGGTTTCWRDVRRMRVGDRIRFATRTWEGSDPDDGWFSGMIDGEGCLRRRSEKDRGQAKDGGCELTVSQVAGPVYNRLVAYLQRSGLTFREGVDKREPGTTSKLGTKPVHKVVVGGMEDLFEIIGKTRPTRFVDSSWWEGKEPGQRKDRGWSKIVSIKPLGQERVIDLQTSTKTYIAEGFVSHNSTLAEAIGAYKFTQQTHLFGVVAADEPSTSAYIFDMFERFVDNIPWWLKPREVEHVKNSEILFDNESHIWVASGKSTRGTEGKRGQLGRGRTISFAHLSELSSWDAAEQIDDAFMWALPTHWRTFVLLESTAKGRHNWWHEHWEVSKAGKGRFFCIFIPWYAEPSKYSTPPPPFWIPTPHTLQHAKRCEESSAKWMGRVIRLSKDQLYWYETTRAYYEAKDQLQKFIEEVGAVDDDETFQHSGRSVFGNSMIQKIREAARPLAAVLEVGPWADLKPGPEPTLREAN